MFLPLLKSFKIVLSRWSVEIYEYEFNSLCVENIVPMSGIFCTDSKVPQGKAGLWC